VFYSENVSFNHLFFSIALVFCTENISFRQSTKFSDQGQVSLFDLYYLGSHIMVSFICSDVKLNCNVILKLVTVIFSDVFYENIFRLCLL